MNCLCLVFSNTAKNVKARHHLLKGAIGTFSEEDYGIEMINKISWIIPFTIFMGSFVDAILVYIYMKYVHQWKDILSSKEVSNSEMESQMEESHELTIETPTERPNDSSDESPIQISTE